MMMGTRFIVLTVFLALVLINCSIADSEVQGDLKTGENGKVLDAVDTTNSRNDKKTVIPKEGRGKDQVGNGSKKGADSNNDSGSNVERGKVGVKEADNGQKKANYAGAEKIMNSDGGSKELGSKGTGNEQKKMDDTGANGKSNSDGSSKELGSKGTGNKQKKTDDMGADNKSNSDGNSKELGSKGTGNEQKKMDNTDGDNKSNSDGNGKQNGSKGAGNEKMDDTSSVLKKTNGKDSEQMKVSDKETKEKATGDSDLQSKDGTLVQGRKEGGEACDSSSNSCTIKEMSVVACLRVPGNESPDLSLLIQNKGKGPVTVTISAPAFLKLEQKQIQVKENNNEKIMVSIGNGETESNIILKAGNGNCTLDFKGMITQGSRKDPLSSQLAYINLLRGTSSAWFLLLVVVVIIASVWIGITLQKMYVARNSSKYQKLEMELPVSGVSKTVPDSNDEWDDNWGDNWDDEEVAVPTSMPVTPSFSSNGIASRRINKDAWKD